MSHSIAYERWIFPARRIKTGNIHLATSLISSSLEVNSFTATVECDAPSILDFKRNAKLIYYSKAGRGTVWRVQNIERIAPKLYKISATSTLGILSEGRHYGGIYTGETAGEVIRDICGSVPVVVKSNLLDFKLYGWLPIAAPRDNLSQVLFVIGAALKSDLDGVLRIQNLWDNLVGTVGPERMYTESKVTYTAPITTVIVSEHHYFRGWEDKNLYTGDALEGDIITFSEPMHSLTATGFSILASGANWAKLSAGSGTLQGKTYIHNVREVARTVSEGADPNVKRVENATLVSLVNSYAVADRLKSFYALRETIEAPIIYRGESTGDLLRFYHPFDKKNVVSCLQSADITLSSTLKAQTKSLINFLPEKVEDIGYYNTRVVILEDQEWVVPEGVESIRAILIGGGQGGASGTPGHGGLSGDRVSSAGVGGEGGSAGVGGEGGHILQFAADVTPGDRYAITIGHGGAGGEQNPSIDSFPGKFGGATTFGPWSSASGPTSDAGFTDPTTQEVFAARGRDGIPGGKGGDGASGAGYAETGGSATDTVGTVYSGGSGGWGHYYPSRGTTAGGGGGGGAAIGNNGADGGEGIIEGYINGEDVLARGGNGGTGASAINPPVVSMRGGGGHGGHGGGGGGGGGKASGAKSNTNGRGAFGGLGSSGSAGVDGAVIIYYTARQEKQSGQFRTRNGNSLLDRLERRFIV